MKSCLLILLLFAHTTITGQVNDLFVLVHTGDEAAKKEILSARDFGAAKHVAAKLGYEAVTQGRTVYFFPVPAWSASSYQAMISLLNDAVINGFDRPLRPNSLTPSQLDHLSRFQRQMPLGGELGDKMRNAPFEEIRLSQTMDIRFRNGAQEFVVPFSPSQIVRFFGETPKPNVEPQDIVAEYPSRPELFGLGTTDFAVSVSRQLAAISFEAVLTRAKELLRNRREEEQSRLDDFTKSLFAQQFGSVEGTRFVNGKTISFSELPAGFQQFLLERSSVNPGWFDCSDPDAAVRFVGSSGVSVVSGSFRVFVDFLGPQSGNSRVGVSWEIGEVARFGR